MPHQSAQHTSDPGNLEEAVMAGCCREARKQRERKKQKKKQKKARQARDAMKRMKRIKCLFASGGRECEVSWKARDYFFPAFAWGNNPEGRSDVK